jgi:BirA family biotin operon repressor/biotin-[acetyl-CoA-carboxylase] ligase
LPQRLAHNSLGSPFVELDSVDSTNNYALAQASAGMARHGTAVFTHEQVAGKGQRGKIWLAEKDSSLILSVLIEPDKLEIQQQYRLSIWVALTVCQFFNKYAAGEAKIKWPNDLYWQDRKAGGILIENIIGGSQRSDSSSSSHWKFAVAGMGININQESFPEELGNAVSLRQITGKTHDTLALSKELCELLDTNWKLMENGDFPRLYADYLKNLYKVGETIKLRRDNRIFEATLKTVRENGKLVIEHGTEEEFWLGEVQWLIGESSPR